MPSSDRCYKLEMKNRPVFMGDIGSLIKLDGIVVGGGGERAMLLLPSAGEYEDPHVPSYTLSNEQWTDWLERSDIPEIMVDPIKKAFHRKAMHEISGLIQQKVWAADAFKCMYCKRRMGEVQLTIDHFMAIELGGKNNTSNYLSACRKCNKDKGSIHPEVWCKSKGLDYFWFQSYLTLRRV